MDSKRTRRGPRAACALALALAVGQPPALGAVRSSDDATASARRFVAGQVLVRFRDGTDAITRAAALAQVGATPVREIPAIGYTLARIPPGVPVADAVRALARHPAVAVAEPNVTGTLALPKPNDRCYDGCLSTRQWNLDAVNARNGWDHFPGTFYTAAQKAALAPVKVAVLDTKIDVGRADWVNASSTATTEPWLASNGGQLARGRDLVGDHLGPSAYHGTFVAGILAASAHNGTDMAGLGYRAEIVPVAVVNGAGQTDAATLAEGILWSVQTAGARVVNLSLVLSAHAGVVQDAINAVRSSAVIVAAAGNDNSDEARFPAAYDGVIAVSAVDEADKAGSCSNRGAHISVAAPGAGVVSLDPTVPAGVSVAACGTSTAAPHVSGLAALLIAQDPTRTPGAVRSLIERNADDDRFRPGRDEVYGHGRINVERALKDGTGPKVEQVRASFPPGAGGTSKATALGVARSTRTILDAEWFLDVPGAPGTGAKLRAQDGAFDETSESLETEIPIPLNGVSTGVHRLYVRANDGEWGAAAAGVLIVDRLKPLISSFEVTRIALGTAGQPVQVTFRAADDYSSHLTYWIQVKRQTAPYDVVYTSAPETAPAPVADTVGWVPAVTDKGPFEVTLTVTDLALNPARATAGTIAV